MGNGNLFYINGSNKNKYFYLLLVLMVALVVADGMVTRFIIMNRLGVEANYFYKNGFRAIRY